MGWGSGHGVGRRAVGYHRRRGCARYCSLFLWYARGKSSEIGWATDLPDLVLAGCCFSLGCCSSGVGGGLVPLSPPFCAGDDACFCRDAVCGAYGYWRGWWFGRPMAAPQCRGFSHTSRPRARLWDAHGCCLLGFCLCGDAFGNGVYWQYIANPDAISGI